MRHINTIYIKTMMLALAAVSASAPLAAQNVSRVHVSGVQIIRDDASVGVSFTISPGKWRLPLTREVTLTPYIISANGTDSVALPALTVAGKNAWYYAERNESERVTPVYLRAGKGADHSYSASAPWQPWMETSRLDFVTVAAGCCPGNTAGAPEPVPVAEMDWRRPVLTPDFRYVTPQVDMEKSYNLSGRAYVSFRVNRTEIDPSYMINATELRKITASIDTVRGNRDATVRSISLTGYASPEGPYSNNVRLAKGRTEAVRDYVSRLYDFPRSVYRTNSVPEDWAGLRDSVAVSILPDRTQILDFIDNGGVAIEKRNDVLRQRFPQSYAYLLKTVYPWLRHTDYVISYTIRKYTDIDEIRRVMREKPGNLSLDELFAGAMSYPQGSDEYNHAFELAVSLYPDSEVANLNAANALMSRGDLKKAAMYLDRAGSSAEADYARGILAALEKDTDKALRLLRKAQAAGFAPAAPAIESVESLRKAPTGVRFVAQ